MRKLIIGLFILFLGIKANAQIGVTDVALNKKLLKQLINNGLTAAYEEIKKEIAKGQLKEAEKLAEKVAKRYDIINNAFKINSEIQGFKKVKNTYNKAELVNKTIRGITSYLASVPDGLIPNDIRKEILKGLNKSLSDMKLANETIDYALDDNHKLSLKERVNQIDAADSKLEQAASNLSKGLTYIKNAIIYKEITDKKIFYFTKKYN